MFSILSMRTVSKTIDVLPRMKIQMAIRTMHSFKNSILKMFMNEVFDCFLICVSDLIDFCFQLFFDLGRYLIFPGMFFLIQDLHFLMISCKTNQFDIINLVVVVLNENCRSYWRKMSVAAAFGEQRRSRALQLHPKELSQICCFTIIRCRMCFHVHVSNIYFYT